MPVVAQRSYTFNAATYNVDGLPQELLNIQINKGGMEEEGAAQMAQKLKRENWDIIGVAEDFNYHEELTSPLSDYYHIGSHSGEVVSLDMLFDSPNGLGFLLAKAGNYPKFSNETTVNFTGRNGNIADGDIFIRKAFRYYTVELAENVAIDVYVLHMDAGSESADIKAREAQLVQLRDYIKENNNGRHILILGDTNCRYTRENLKSLFIDGLHSADNTLTVRDAWVEMMWAGRYPTYGGDAMMVDQYGDQRGEVVDKILYIENSKSPYTITLNRYERDMSFPVTDHYPVVANFTITVPEGSQVDWTVEGGSTSSEQELDGEAVANNGVYWLRNVSSGLYLKAGAAWGTAAAEGSAGMPITFIANDEGKYKLQTVSAALDGDGKERSLGHGCFMDNTDGNYWTLEPVAGSEYQYYIYYDGGALTSFAEGDANKSVTVSTLDKSNDKQKWILLSEERMKSEMQDLANAATPFDATPLIHAADFDAGNSYDWPQDKKWSGYENVWTNFYGGHDPYGAFAYIYRNSVESTISQTLSNMPVGKYVLKYQAFYNYERTETGKITGNSSTESVNLSATMTFGSATAYLERNAQLSFGDFASVATSFRNKNYSYTLTDSLSAESPLRIALYKPKTNEMENESSGLYRITQTSWICLDNLQLLYYGTESSAEALKQAVLDMLAAYINDAWQEVKDMDPNTTGDVAEAVFDITALMYRYNNGLISEDGEAEKAIVDAAVEISRLAHKKAIIDDAINNGDGDVTGLIVNPSFEEGIKGWNLPTTAWGVNVKPNSDPAVTVTNADEDYILDAYHSDDATSVPTILQTVTGLKNGLYELKALITSFEDNTVYLKGNTYHKGFTADVKTTFKEGTLYFLVEDGTATIGAVGGYNGYYYPTGCFYKADNFRLKYVCDAPHGRVKLAIDDAKEIAEEFDSYASFDISTYETAYENRTITGDGSAEVKAIYSALQAAAKQQKTKNADMTYAITNPNFELDGDYQKYTGWTCATGGDTKAASQENTTYAFVGVDGRYLFNTWADGTSKTLSQKVTDIPNGTYQVSAMVASDSGNSINLTANEKTESVAAGTGKEHGVRVTVQCVVTDHTLDISVAGANNAWFKADDFRLTFLYNKLELDHSKDETATVKADWYTDVDLLRPVATGKWHSFVVPYSMPVPENWDVRELTNGTIDETGTHLYMVFNRVEKMMEAGTPYMVRYYPQGVPADVDLDVNTDSDTSNDDDFTKEQTNIITEYVDVNLSTRATSGEKTVTGNPAETSTLEFVGSYVPTEIPEGAIFISNNKFYVSKGTSRIKGYRGYIVPRGDAANARTFGMRTRGGNSTDIESANNADATVVGIYDINGMLLNEMQDGLNILRMSDGTTIKIMMK